MTSSPRDAATPEVSGDLLGLLLSARDEATGEGMTDTQLRDEVITFFAAGHETTALALDVDAIPTVATF